MNGASTCDLAVILIDARYGVQTQTKRHSFIASLLGIKHIIVAVNKMDLVEFSEQKFNQIRQDYLDFISRLNLTDIHFLPISALDGDNVVNPSENMPWFTGVPMMELLNTIEIAQDRNFTDARFPVQYVNRPNLDFRGFCGTVASGVFKQGDAITVLPSGKKSTIKSIVTYDGDIEQAFPPMSVTLTLKDEIDISRGDLIIGQTESTPMIADKFTASVVWMSEKPLVPGRQYIIKQATRSVTGSVSAINYRIDVNTLEHHDANELNLNEIASCHLSLNAPVVFDPYFKNKGTGSFIIIDRLSNVTVGAGMITGEADAVQLAPVSPEERAARFSQQAVAIAITGSESHELATQLERKLFDTGHATILIHETEGSDLDHLLSALKQAGLIVIIAGENPSADLNFDSAMVSLDDMYLELKKRKIVF